MHVWDNMLRALRAQLHALEVDETHLFVAMLLAIVRTLDPPHVVRPNLGDIITRHMHAVEQTRLARADIIAVQNARDVEEEGRAMIRQMIAVEGRAVYDNALPFTRHQQVIAIIIQRGTTEFLARMVAQRLKHWANGKGWAFRYKGEADDENDGLLCSDDSEDEEDQAPGQS